MSVKSILPDPDTSEDGVYQIYGLCYAKLQTRRAHDNFVTRDMHDGPMPLNYNLWILRNARRTVIVDTGFGARAAAERGRERIIDRIDALRQLGVDPDLIGDVILTHMH